MRAKTFFEALDHFADDPNGVVRIREVLLELAVQGRLVPQVASESLDASPHSCVEKGQSPNSPLSDDDAPLPTGWGRASLGEIAEKITDGTHKTPRYVPEGVPFISVKDFSGGRLDFSSTRFISPDEHCDLYKRCDPRRGDILIGRIGTIGKAVVVDTDREFSVFVSAGLIRLKRCCADPAYFRHLLNSLTARLKFDGIKVGGATHTNKLNLGDLRQLRFSVPPLAEQKRIVAKVDELMALCDRLEAQQKERETRHAALARASLSHFADAPTPANLILLFHKSYTIPPADLRKSILTLAVRGELVPFDASDKQTVGDHVEFQNGFAFKSAWFRPTGTRLCRNANVNHGFLDWRESAFVDGKIAKELQRFALAENDIVLSLDRPLISTGLKVARIRKSDLPCLLLQRVARAVPKHDELDPSYFLLWLNSFEFVDSIDPGRSKGVPHISTRQVERLSFALPPLAEQRRIVAKVDQLMALVDELETQLAASRATAAKLLDAIVGELTA